MSLPACATIMDDKALNRCLTKLEIATGSEPPTVEQIRDFSGRFAELRVRVKYLAFDVEATRRENVFLRKILKEKPFEG